MFIFKITNLQLKEFNTSRGFQVLVELRDFVTVRRRQSRDFTIFEVAIMGIYIDIPLHNL